MRAFDLYTIFKAVRFLAVYVSIVVLLAAWSQGEVMAGGYGLPPAKYELRIEKSVLVPMRDGVRLLTDLYFPVGLEGEKLPVVLATTAVKGSLNQKS